MIFRVVLDACVLYPFSLRDILLRLAERELYDAYWSDRMTLWAKRPETVRTVLREQADDLADPPVTVEELLDFLARIVPGFVMAVRGK